MSAVVVLSTFFFFLVPCFQSGFQEASFQRTNTARTRGMLGF